MALVCGEAEEWWDPLETTQWVRWQAGDRRLQQTTGAQEKQESVSCIRKTQKVLLSSQINTIVMIFEA